MYLKRVSIDGFKSYGQEVVVGEFAPQFNAITGLNGSGKSNILDSICYVMALKSLQQMRVGKLDDLVYKSGQAGVRKARVTLIFDNSDKATSPPLFRNCAEIIISRAIVVGGRDKYTINGKLARATEVHSLFHSVGLNVNNPHFLIMQGRITRVISMRPSEILSLVEEAAGTKIYENKKRDSENRMVRKETELKEIEELIKQEIDPQMQKFAKDRECHTLWTRLGKDITEKQKLCLFLKFCDLQKLLERNKKSERDTRSVMELSKQEIDMESNRLTEYRELFDKATREDHSNDHQSALKSKEVDFEKIKKTYLSKKVDYEGQTGEKSRLEKLHAKNTKHCTELKGQRSKLLTDNAAYLKEIENATNKLNELQNGLEIKETELENLRSGNLTDTSEDGVTKNVTTLVNDKKKLVAQLRKDITEHQGSITMYEQQLRSMPSLEEEDKKLASLRETIKQSETRLNAVITRIDQCGFDEAQYERATQELSKRENDLKEEEMKLSQYMSRVRPDNAKRIITEGLDLKNIAARYFPDNPKIEQGVVGAVFSLFTIKESLTEFTLAVEQIATAKLTNCVVRDDIVAEKMFQASKKQKRSITCIPLNRIKNTFLDKNLVARAKKLCPDGVHDPIDLIECHAMESMPALLHVFSGYLVCRDKTLARQIVKMGLNCVTADGDTYSTGGGVSGGSTAGYFDLVSQYRPMAPVVRAIQKAKVEINSYKDVLDSAEENRSIFNKYRIELDKERRSFTFNTNLLKAEKETSSVGDREDMIQKLENERKQLQEREASMKSASMQLNAWEQKQNSSKSNMDSTIKKLEKEIPKLRSDLKKQESLLTKQKTQNTDVLHEIEELAASIEQKNASALEQKAELRVLEDVVEEYKQEASEWKTKMDDLQQLIKDLKSDMANSNAQCARLKKDIEKTEKSIEKARTNTSNHKRSLEEMRATVKEIAHRMDSTMEESPWLKEDPKQHFHNLSPDITLKQVAAELDSAKEERTRLESRFNKKVLQKIDEAEKNYMAIVDRRETVLRDRDAIVDFIKELDEKKAQEVAQCQTLVNDHFNSIFSTLLPNTGAQLEPVEDGKSNGLQMRVAFHGKWKTGLTELSGGQRSLLALSFVLALLKYKPAPMYILDEVDAALDLSHTQNIGKLIHNHFNGSQFIIVSLKPNLFTNADVIFKTSLVQGMSQVRRLVGSDAMIEMVQEKRKKVIKEDPEKENV